MRSKMDCNVNWHITKSTSNHYQSFSLFGVVMEPRLGGWVSLPPVILEGSLAMMSSIIHCKCCRCYVAVEMNNSDLLNQWRVSDRQLLKVSADFQWWIDAAFVVHFRIPWLIDCGEIHWKYMLSLYNMGVLDHWHSHGENQFVTVRPKPLMTLHKRYFCQILRTSVVILFTTFHITMHK